MAAFGCSEGARDSSLAALRGQTALDEGRADLARLYFQEARAQQDSPELQRAEAMAWLSGHQQSLTEAIQLLTGYLTSVPQDDDARRELGRALNLLGRTEEAQTVLSHPDCAPCRVQLAEMLADTDPASAIVLLGPEGGPDASGQDWEPPHWAARARAAASSKDAQAIEWCRKALERSPLNVELWYLMAREHAKLQDRDAAAQALEIQRALRVLFADGTLGEASPQTALESITALEALLKAKLQLEPWQLLRQRSQALGRLVADPNANPTAKADALGQLQATITQLQNQDPPEGILVELATIAGEAGLRGLAQQLFAHIRESDPEHAGATASLVMLALDQNDLDLAQLTLKQGLETRPNFGRFQLLKARLEQRLGDLDAAQLAFDEALLLAPWNAQWRLEYVELLRALGDERWQAILDGATESSALVSDYRARLGLGLSPDASDS